MWYGRYSIGADEIPRSRRVVLLRPADQAHSVRRGALGLIHCVEVERCGRDVLVPEHVAKVREQLVKVKDVRENTVARESFARSSPASAPARPRGQ